MCFFPFSCFSVNPHTVLVKIYVSSVIKLSAMHVQKGVWLSLPPAASAMNTSERSWRQIIRLQTNNSHRSASAVLHNCSVAVACPTFSYCISEHPEKRKATFTVSSKPRTPWNILFMAEPALDRTGVANKVVSESITMYQQNLWLWF